MEKACVCVFLVLCLVQSIFCQDCKLNFTEQPSSELTCRPTTLTTLALYCTTSDSFVDLNWFYTNDKDQAGITGTKINNSNSQGLVIDTNYNYQQPRLTLSVNDRTVGFYWCKVTDERYSNVSVRSSAVAHIQSLNAYNNSSLNQSCGNTFVNLINSSIQCAIISMSSSSTVLPPMPSSEASIQDSVSITGTPSRSSSVSITPPMSSSFIYIALSTSPSFLVPSPSPSPSISLSATTSSSSLSFTPTLSLEPSPTTTGDTENNVLILYALAGVCGLLAVIALVIVIAIFVLCYLTKHQSRRRSYTPKGQSGEDSSGVGGRRNSDDEKPSSQSPQQNTNNNINPLHVLPPPSHSQVQQRGLSFSNPVYDIAKVQSSGSDAFDVFPPRIVPPDKPNTNSLPKYAKPDLSKKKSHSDEEYVSPHSTLPSGSVAMYDQVAVSPTGTSSTIGSQPPPSAEEPPELPPSLNLYDDPNQLSPILNSPPAAYEEPHITSPNIASPPPPLPPPPVESALYDDPHEVVSPSYQRPDSYMQPLALINNINNNKGGEKENYYSMPVDAMPHEYHELMNVQASNQASTTTNASTMNETAPDNSAAPQESAYDDPWGPMPTGIKRGSSRSSKSHGGRSHSINHSVSPNLFDDPQYDTPSPHQTTPIETNNY